MKSDSRPIGLFDSGVGGLTVLKTLLQEFPNESFIYLGDTARLPYGSKSPETISRYLHQNIRFLLSQNVKAIVIACNSASTTVLGKHPEFPVPVYNVIEPGAKAAFSVSQNKKIGVLGTKATIAAKSYVHALHALDKTITVYQAACPLLVPLVEEGWEEDPLTNLVVYRYLQPVITAGVDTLILGCTHYPSLRQAFLKVVGRGVTLVDSSSAIADLIKADLNKGVLCASLKSEGFSLLTTDISLGFHEVASRLLTPSVAPALIAVDIS